VVNTEIKEAKKAHEIGVFSANCSGCMLCALACSFLYTKAFSLFEARIKVRRVGKTEEYMIIFTEDCTRCGECAKYCYFDAVVWK